jgi:hypothetical protein
MRQRALCAPSANCIAVVPAGGWTPADATARPLSGPWPASLLRASVPCREKRTRGRDRDGDDCMSTTMTNSPGRSTSVVDRTSWQMGGNFRLYSIAHMTAANAADDIR